MNKYNNEYIFILQIFKEKNLLVSKQLNWYTQVDFLKII